MNPKPWTPNHEPQTMNPKPWTLNPEPRTPNQEPQTKNPKPWTPNHEPQTIMARAVVSCQSWLSIRTFRSPQLNKMICSHQSVTDSVRRLHPGALWRFRTPRRLWVLTLVAPRQAGEVLVLAVVHVRAVQPGRHKMADQTTGALPTIPAMYSCILPTIPPCSARLR